MLIVHVIIAAGVILSSEPTPIEQRNFSDEPVKAAGIFGSGGLQPSKNNSEAIPTEPPKVVVPSLPGKSESDLVYGKCSGQIRIFDSHINSCLLSQSQILWMVR